MSQQEVMKLINRFNIMNTKEIEKSLGCNKSVGKNLKRLEKQGELIHC
jgi:hypothetical protein